MGDVVSLNQFRKKRDRKNSETTARNNRVRFGRTLNQRQTDNDQRARKDAELENKKLTRTPKDNEESDPEN
ncbi:MAG: DUF4169 family protein [Sneathiella sp.]|nr:DUF4169 family protein [Sneathiella sp.]